MNRKDNLTSSFKYKYSWYNYEHRILTPGFKLFEISKAHVFTLIKDDNMVVHGSPKIYLVYISILPAIINY